MQCSGAHALCTLPVLMCYQAVMYCSGFDANYLCCCNVYVYAHVWILIQCLSVDAMFVLIQCSGVDAIFGCLYNVRGLIQCLGKSAALNAHLICFKS